MKLTDELMKEIENAQTKEAKKEILEKAGIELSVEELEMVAGGIDIGGSPANSGIKCPLCKQDLTITLAELRYGGKKTCPICGFPISIDQFKNNNQGIKEILEKIDPNR